MDSATSTLFGVVLLYCIVLSPALQRVLLRFVHVGWVILCYYINQIIGEGSGEFYCFGSLVKTMGLAQDF